MTLYALDPRGTSPTSLAAAAVSNGFGPAEKLEAVEPGVYEARATGPCMLCFGTDIHDGGVLVTPDSPAQLVVEQSERLVAAAMGDACTLTLVPVVRVPEGLIREAARSSSTRASVRARCG